MFTFIRMIFSIRAAPHEVPFAFFLSIWEHGKPGIAQRGTVFVNADGIMDRFRASAFAVEVNKGAYATCLEETVSGHVIHSGIKAHIFDGERACVSPFRKKR